jgi:hypothetical protein
MLLLVKNRTWYFIPFVIGCLCKFRPPFPFLPSS